MQGISCIAKNDELYGDIAHAGPSKPICNLYSQNLDFSSFPLLCDIVYRELKCINPQVMLLLPFCVFMHAMTTCLNAWLFNIVTYINGENRYSHEKDAISLIPRNMIIPRPIAEYFAMINTAVTPSGDTVCVNVPDSCLPQTTVQSYEENVPDIPPGSFGSVTAESHNTYECYVSPYVTRQLCEATRKEATEYMPLPQGHFPLNTFPNQNLLGYFPPEQPSVEGLELLNKYTFPNTDDMVGRLQYVEDLMFDVSYYMIYCFKYCDMNYFHNIRHNFGQTTLVYTRLDVVSPGERSRDYIAPILSNLYSPYKFGAITTAQTTLFALRRQRSNLARGLCYTTAAGFAPESWSNTINDNFNMVGQFTPEIGMDHPHLRDALHQVEMPSGDRVYIINNWIKTFEYKR